MAKSLVILATHNPPDVPGIVIPTVRILRLSAPLALEDTGAVRFVNVLEWAERVSRTWRKHGGGGVVELTEDAAGQGELAPPSMSRFGSQSTPTSPGSSSTFLSTETGSSSRPPSRPSSIAGSFFTRRAHGSLPPPDPSQRPFDILLNFMPQKVSDKALLKNSILVTTISRPFLTSSVHPSAPTIRSRTASSSSTRLRPQSIFGAFSRSSTSVYMPPTPPCQSGESLSLAQMMLAPPGKALLIHLLPPPPANSPPAARRKLVESMESFLLSFAFQTSPAQLHAQVPGSSPSDPLERARPYVMETTTFCDAVSCEPGVADYGDWTVADVVLSGALDADNPNAPPAPPTMTTSVSVGAVPKASKSSRRAWIAAAADLVIMPSGDDPTASMEAAKLQAPATSHQSNRTFEKSRSISSPLLTTDWSPSSTSTSRPVSTSVLSQPAFAVARQGKGAYSPTSPILASSGLPTPPHSEEEAGSGGDSISLDASAQVTSSSSISVAGADGASVGGRGDGDGQSGSAKKSKWKFWRRLGAGHHAHAQPAPLKA